MNPDLVTVVAAFAVLAIVSLLLPYLSGLVTGIGRYSGRAAKRSDKWIGFSERFPRLADFLQRRFDPTRPAGLAVTLLGIGALYALLLAGGLIEELYDSEGLAQTDAAIFAELDRFRSPQLIAFFSFVTKFGNTETLVAMVVVATGFMLAHGPRRYIVPMWIVIAGSQITTWAGKFLVNRPRPDFIFDVTAISPSFPSAHASSSTAILGMIAYVVGRDLPYRMRLQLAYWTAVVIGLIGLSRMFLNVHYPSDVAAGHLVGVFWLLAGMAMAELSRPLVNDSN